MIVFVKSTGGQLANRILTFAHIYSFCLHYRFKLVHIGFEEYAPLFESTRGGSYLKVPNDSAVPVPAWRRRCVVKLLRLGMSALVKMPFTKGFLARKTVGGMGDTFEMTEPSFVESLRGKKILRLEGFVFRADELVVKYANELRTFFTPAQPHRDNIRAFVQTARQSCDLLVGVHIRRGDYKGFMGGKYYFEVEQYAEVMRATAALFPEKRIHFVVCSNEKLTVEQFKQLDVVFGPGHQIEDLYSLAACDYLIGTHSTFAGWAAFYGSVPVYLVCDPAHRPTINDFEKKP